MVIIKHYFKNYVRSGSYKFFQLLDEIETHWNKDAVYEYKASFKL